MPPSVGARTVAQLAARRSRDRRWCRARGPDGGLRAREAGARQRSRCSKLTTSSAELPEPRSTKASGSTSAATASSPRSRSVEDLWHEILGPEFISVPRLSRIHYNGRFFDYPLKLANALRGLGPINALRIVLSYVKWHYRPYPIEENFEQWVTNRFGKRLYEIFFKTYTEKVWGIPCTEIRAEWAAQRIQGLSLARAILNATALHKRMDTIKSLIHEFQYPRLGPGQMWETCRDRVVERGHPVLLQHTVAPTFDDASRRTRDGGSCADTGRSANFRSRARHFHHADPLAGARDLTRRARARAAGGGGPSIQRLPGRGADPQQGPVCFPTTGSTFTRRASRSGASRTSTTGARRWCRSPARPAWGWSISVSKATGSGRAATRS